MGLITRVDLELTLPDGFPEKYESAIINAMNLCSVKKHLHQPPEFADHHQRGAPFLMADQFDPTHAKKLEDPERLEALPQATVVELLRLTGAETVVDYGAGTGIYTVAIADALPDGKVFAVEALPQPGRAAAGEDHAGAREAHVHLRDRRQRGPARRRRGRPGSDGRRAAPPARPARRAGRSRLECCKPGGLFVVVDWGDTERPVGPPPGHVLGLAAVRDIITGMGLDMVEDHEPGDLLRYHVVAVARKR